MLLARILREKGWDADEARGVWSIDEGSNMLIDVTKGAQYVQEAKDMIISGYRWSLGEGPLAYEHIRGLKVKIVDISLHEDPVHRGPGTDDAHDAKSVLRRVSVRRSMSTRACPEDHGEDSSGPTRSSYKCNHSKARKGNLS